MDGRRRFTTLPGSRSLSTRFVVTNQAQYVGTFVGTSLDELILGHVLETFMEFDVVPFGAPEESGKRAAGSDFSRLTYVWTGAGSHDWRSASHLSGRFCLISWHH